MTIFQDAWSGLTDVTSSIRDEIIGKRPQPTQTPVLNPEGAYVSPEVLRLRERGQQSGLAPGVQIGTQGIRAREADQLGARQTQSDFITALQDAAAGRGGPSAAQDQLSLARQAAIADQMSMAGSARGGALAHVAAQRAAQQAAGRIESDAGYQSGILRAQEQQAARQQLGQAIEAQRARDLQAQGMSLEEAVQQARLEAEQKRLNQERELAYLSQEQRAAEAIQQGGYRQADLEMLRRAQDAGQAGAWQGRATGLYGGLFGAASAPLAQAATSGAGAGGGGRNFGATPMGGGGSAGAAGGAAATPAPAVGSVASAQTATPQLPLYPAYNPPQQGGAQWRRQYPY